MIATAESCTAGMIAAALTDVPGASAVLDRGFVTYTNAAKEELLGVRVPPRCEVVRVLCCELARIGAHLLWLGTHALDLGAAGRGRGLCARHAVPRPLAAPGLA